MEEANYSVPVPLEWYKCSKCGRTGVKLWWYGVDSKGHSEIQLYCAQCAVKEEEGLTIIDINAEGLHIKNGELTDTIGYYLPAIPAPSTRDLKQIVLWLYSSVPEVCFAWWKALPTI